MANRSYKQRYAIDQENRKRIKKLNPDIGNQSGIYFFTRTDEDGVNHAYIGQASTSLLNRCAQHLSGYQYIDLSLKSHGLYDAQKNPYGYKLGFTLYPVEELDKWEEYWILQYAKAGYQLKNRTGGKQGKGKKQINEYRPQKGYRDGIKQGRKNLAKELLHIIEKHLIVAIKPEKAHNKVSQDQFAKFWDLLNTDERELDDGDIQKCPNDILDGCKDS